MPPKLYLDALARRRLPRDARQGRRPRDPEVGHLVPGQQPPRAAGGDGRDLRVERRGRRAARADRRARGHRAAHRRGGRGGRAGARPRGRRSVGIVGCGSTASWAARCLAAAEFGPGVCFDLDPEAAGRAGRRARLGGGHPRGCARRATSSPASRPGTSRWCRPPTCARGSTCPCSAPTARARPRRSPARSTRCRAVLRRVGAGVARRRAHRRRRRPASSRASEVTELGARAHRSGAGPSSRPTRSRCSTPPAWRSRTWLSAWPCSRRTARARSRRRLVRL